MSVLALLLESELVADLESLGLQPTLMLINAIDARHANARKVFFTACSQFERGCQKQGLIDDPYPSFAFAPWQADASNQSTILRLFLRSSQR